MIACACDLSAGDTEIGGPPGFMNKTAKSRVDGL